MQIQPRHEILQVWRALAEHSQPDWQQWSRAGGGDSVGDAERLLCLLAPATELDHLRLDRPSLTARDVREALDKLGDNIDVPKVIVRLLRGYLDAYTTEDGSHVFSGGARIQGAQHQRELYVVDAYAVSVVLMLSALTFLYEFRRSLTRPDLREELEKVRTDASRRLTAAMVGLMRSFAVNVFPDDSEFGREQVRCANQDGAAADRVIDDLRTVMGDIHVRLSESVTDNEELQNPNRLFECGWSWGVVTGTPALTGYQVGEQQSGVAEPAPYLYFTVVALDAIEMLISQRTRLLGLLEPAQAELANDLRVRLELTRSFWAKLATFGSGARWPLEDLPWRTTDGLEHEYYSLLVGGMVVQDLAHVSAGRQRDLGRVGEVYARLARRVRITERATIDDRQVVRAHGPGVREPLRGSGSNGGADAGWIVSDIAPLLLRQTLRLAGLLSDGDARERVERLSQDLWDHLFARRVEDGVGRGLWDQPARIFGDLVEPQQPQPSWFYTRRVVDCLIAQGRLVSGRPPDSVHLHRTATSTLKEADHLLRAELFRGTGLSSEALQQQLVTVEVTLRRAHAVLAEKPATAIALAEDALRELDRLAAARAAGQGML
ncbi:SCO2524 family protein [Actinoplanes sp. N902-109]|uniref:SCO2524 family protein n=1 Tax=Actinoplanes sp. (strain N902-109) TaxID=649831 RepID=UPI00032954C1|nr:SCO2524 family protein [Actinoplanes sp. N902-109]AGL18310.1 hypothetical protein L083_4800 [Actinoplanes sp. N902-109]